MKALLAPHLLRCLKACQLKSELTSNYPGAIRITRDIVKGQKKKKAKIYLDLSVYQTYSFSREGISYSLSQPNQLPLPVLKALAHSWAKVRTVTFSVSNDSL